MMKSMGVIIMKVTKLILISSLFFLCGCTTTKTCWYLEGEQSGLIELCDDNTTYELDCSGEKCIRTVIERTEQMQVELDTWVKKIN